MATSNNKIKKGYERVYLDVMIKDRFVCQLIFYYCPLFKITDEELNEFVVKNKPNLVKKKFKVFFSVNRVLRK